MLTSNAIQKSLGVRVKGDVYHYQGPSGQPKPLIYDQSEVGESYNDTKNKWFSFGVEDNAPDLLRKLYRKSTIHNSAINLKAGLIHGDGLKFTPLKTYFRKDENGEIEKVEQPDYSDKQIKDLICQAEIFARKIGAWEYYKQAAMEYSLLGGYASMREYYQDEFAEVKMQGVYVESFCKVRLGSKRKFIDGKHRSTIAYLSSNFNRASGYCDFGKYLGSSDNYTAVRLDGDKKKKGTFYKAFGRVTPYREIYPTPDYESEDALRYISTDGEISKKDLNDLLCGFTLEYIAVRYRKRLKDPKLEAEEKKKDKELFKESAQGVEGKKVAYLWAEPHEVEDSGTIETPKSIEIIMIPHNNTAERYNVLREERLMKILNAHTIIIPELIGLSPTVGKGFQNQAEHLMTAQQQLYSNFAKPAKKIIDSDLSEIYQENGIPVSVTSRNSMTNYRLLNAEIMKFALTTNEIRSIYEYENLDEDELAEIIERQSRRTQQDGL